MKQVFEINMTEGSIPKKMSTFILPIMVTNVLQILFNATDMMVVGRFAGAMELAAVGACSSLINLLVILFTGISSACNIIVATYYGAGKRDKIREVIQTAMLVALILGLVMTVFGIICAPFGLHLISTPENVTGAALIYMRIYFLSMPAMLIYNYGASILRAIGDTKRPLYFLIISGVIRIALNLIFVIFLHLGVAGVAVAATITQYLSAFMIVFYLMTIQAEYRLDIRKLKIYGSQLKELMRIGIPAGIQGTMFSVSNVVIQSSINSFGSTVIAACSAVSNIEGIVYMMLSSISQSTMSFTAQNMGAGKYKRVKQIVFVSVAATLIVGTIMSAVMRIGGGTILRLYTYDNTVLAAGVYRIKVVCLFYLFCGMMDVVASTIRGLGYSFLPTIVSLIGACGLRILWIVTVFHQFPSEQNLYLAYPVSWIVTTIAHGICLVYLWKKLERKRRIQNGI